MVGKITGTVRYGKSLAILTESSIVVTHDNGKEPNDWPREVFSEVGTNNEFVRQIADEFMELMDPTSIFDPQRQDIKDALMVLLIEGLLPAYVRLREIRSSTGQQIPVLNRRQHSRLYRIPLQWTIHYRGNSAHRAGSQPSASVQMGSNGG